MQKLCILFQQNKSPMSWNQRCKILKDACRGLVWLHESDPPLIHQDIKSYVYTSIFHYELIPSIKSTIHTCRANILINRGGTGKLGDFGFALELPESSSTVVTAPSFARTEGYYAPELVSGQLSAKSDVYSFGVVSSLNGPFIYKICSYITYV